MELSTDCARLVIASGPYLQMYCVYEVQHGNVLVNCLSTLMVICWESLGVETD